MKNIVRVGVGVFVIKNGKFLIGKRAGAHGEGTWALIGGHMEFGESIEDTARREVLEEVGVEIKNVRYVGTTNDNEAFKNEGRHYINLYVVSELANGEPVLAEPDKMTELRWCDLDSLPEPLFAPWPKLLKADFLYEVKQALKNTKS